MRKSYSLDVAILLLVVALPSYPYDLERQLGAFGYVWSKPGAIYPQLKRLAQDGLVSCAWETPPEERPRLIYSITEVGIAYLQHMAIPHGTPARA